MTILKNEGIYDRLVRLLFAEGFFLVAFFWAGGMTQLVSYGLAFVFLATAISGFCPVYRLIRFHTGSEGMPVSRIVLTVFVLVIVLVAVAGSLASIFFTKKFFLEDFNRMNGYYKQTLFNTGQDKRAESVANYEGLVAEYGVFSAKYMTYHPFVVRGDAAFDADILRVGTMIAALDGPVHTGVLSEAHQSFEQIRPIFQDMLKRNGFSMLSVALVDFHDAMETVIAPADQKDGAGVIAAYPEADVKLRAVEEAADDADITAIREHLDAIRMLAEDGSIDLLPSKAAELKSSFVKVYLQRG